jgi:pyruvate/2-oxoacid:ferredoxin oxidoreductase alpha subunit/NAD-dependent dihydropyrimidine dehydrogenase PreA subunit
MAVPSARPPGRSIEKKVRPKPILFPELCKACDRCIAACPKDCLFTGDRINPLTGLVPVDMDLEACNGCALCFDACPEPYGLMPAPVDGFDVNSVEAGAFIGGNGAPKTSPSTVPDEHIQLPSMEPMVLKGTHASAIGAVLAGCRHFYGYPITPSTEGAELLAQVLPRLDGVFLQAASEVAAINMMYGCGGAGLRTMTFTSSPGFSLMLEGLSYMVGAEVPAVVVNVMRGGPGLGNIASEQSDIKLACRGLGHGNTHAIVLAPSTPQEMLDLTMEAFDLSFKYRNPVIVLPDGYLGQITGRVRLPDSLVRPGLPDWAVFGDAEHRGNLICSIRLEETELEAHNIHLNEKYDRMRRAEQRSEAYRCDDAEWIVVACNSVARTALGAVQALREQGIRVGLFRPISLWPFPVDALLPILEHAWGIVVVEAGPGQLEDELRLALSHADVRSPAISHVRRMGGIAPQQHDIIELVTALEEA